MASQLRVDLAEVEGAVASLVREHPSTSPQMLDGSAGRRLNLVPRLSRTHRSHRYVTAEGRFDAA
jgi:hypothetical protein